MVGYVWIRSWANEQGSLRRLLGRRASISDVCGGFLLAVVVCRAFVLLFFPASRGITVGFVFLLLHGYHKRTYSLLTFIFSSSLRVLGCS